MAYTKCFICGEEDYTNNENRIELTRIWFNKKTMVTETNIFKGYICDTCFEEHFKMEG